MKFIDSIARKKKEGKIRDAVRGEKGKSVQATLALLTSI